MDGPVTVERMLTDVERFHLEVLNYPAPDKPTMMSAELAKFRLEFLGEELGEFQEGVDLGDFPKQVDALVDLIYVALGTLLLMGVTPGIVWAAVHQANMAKVPGHTPNRPRSPFLPEGMMDAMKPPGWQPPDHSWVLALSPVLAEVAAVRARKGADYNRNRSESHDPDAELRSYFPFGQISYAQMAHIKAKRVVNLCKEAMEGREPANEPLRDSYLDLINYATFAVEALDASQKGSS